jgi:hypothetical protein
MVTITVGQGDSQKTFQMYRGLLCFHSEYFKNLFEGGFKEAQSDTHMMPETAVDTFELFYAWVCTGTISKSDGVCDNKIGHESISQLYAFADYHMVEELKNRAVELFFIHTIEAWQCWFVGTQKLYDRTAEGCSLRRLHVDILLAKYSFKDIRTSIRDLPTDFIADLLETSKAKGLVCGRANSLTKALWYTSMRGTFCKDYHVHTSTPDQRSTEPAYVYGRSRIDPANGYQTAVSDSGSIRVQT